MSKTKKILIILTILLPLITFYFIDQYIYSWTGFLASQAGICQSKFISASSPNKDNFKKLFFPANFENIASSLNINPNYSVSSTQETLTISRKFDGLDYQIVFENRGEIYYKLLINSSVGEKCITSDFEIYKKILQIVDDISLDERAKRGILSDIKIYQQ